MLKYLLSSSKKYIVFLFLLIGLVSGSTESIAQFVYLEDFTLPSGTTVDNGDSPWTRDISGTNLGLPDDHFEVRDNNGAGLLIFQAVDTDGEAVWSSGIVDISTLSQATISLDVAEAGFMENNDYLRVSYILDGGAEVRFVNLVNDFGATFQTVDSPVLTGNTLQVIVRVRNNRDNELHAFDNVAISGPGNDLFARQDGNWNSLESWSYDGPTGVSCSCFPDENSTAIINNNNTINITSFSEVNDLLIQNTGALIWSVNNELNVFNNGTINVQQGGLIDMTGFETSQLDVAESAGDFRLIVDGTLIANDIDLNGSDAILNISGSGTISVLKDLRFDFDRITINNNFQGAFTMQGNILLSAANSVINNNGKMEVVGDIQFDNPFGTALNQTINNSDSLIVNDIFVQENNSIINNQVGGYLSFRDLDVIAGFELNLDNNGRLQMGGNFIGNTASSEFTNNTNAEWRYEGNGVVTDIILNAEADNNTFVYTGTNQQIITPQNGYFNLTLSNNGSKSANNGLSVLSNLTINDDAQLDLVSNSADISLGGDFNNNSSNVDALLAASRTVTLNGNGDQSVNAQGADFFNITLDKTGGFVDISSALDLNAALRFNSVTDVNANGNLRLVSTTDADDLDNGRILSIPNGARVNGDVTVERYISGEGSIWRYVSSAVENATVASWQDDVSITGRFNDPSSGIGVIRPSLASFYFYDEIPSGSLLTGWTMYPTSGFAADNPLVPGVGYALYVFNGEEPKTLDATGPINQGTFDLNVTYTNSGNSSEDGWNLVGNPYPSTIDWDNPGGWLRSGLANATYIRDNSQGVGIFATYIDGLGTNNGSSQIAAGQAFWVQAIADNPQLQITELAKVDQGRTFFSSNEPKSYLRLSLSNGRIKDEAIVRFKNNASAGFNPQEDAKKRSNNSFNLASYTEDGDIMAINALPEIQCNQEVPMFIQYLTPGEYTLKVDEIININRDMKIYLKDQYTDEILDVQFETSHRFTVNEEASSYASQRFVLLFEREESPSYPVTQVQACQGQEINLPIIPGFINYQLSIGEDNIDFELDANLLIFTAESFKEQAIITLSAYSERCGTKLTLELPLELVSIPQISTINTQVDCEDNSVILAVNGSSSISQVKVYSSINTQRPIYTFEGVDATFSERDWQDTYYVVAYNELGCASVRHSFDVDFPDLQPEVLQVNDTTLQANYDVNIQWFQDGEPVAGATNQFLNITSSGSYGFEVVQSGCSEFASIDVVVESESDGEVVTDVEVIDTHSTPNIFPNPTSRFLNIPVDQSDIQKIIILDARGVIVYSSDNIVLSENSGLTTVDLINLPNGLYVVKIIGRENEFGHQFIKQ